MFCWNPWLTRFLPAEQSVISPTELHDEPGYDLHLSAFIHPFHSFLALSSSFLQYPFELHAYLKSKSLDCSCLCHLFLLSYIYVPYSAVIQFFSLQVNASGYMQRNASQTTLWGLHVYSLCDSYQICSTYNCKYVFIAASSAQTCFESQPESILAHTSELQILLFFCSVRILVGHCFMLLSSGSLSLEGFSVKTRPWILTPDKLKERLCK